MTPTLFLPIALMIVAGAAFVRDRMGWIFASFIVSLAFGGTAVVLLPMLGGASILVCHLLFICLLAYAITTIPASALSNASSLHAPGLLLAAYALLVGYFGPRLFGGADVPVLPMRDATFGPVPLAPQGSNVTHTLYFLGSIVLATVVTALFSSKLRFDHLRRSVLILGGLHALFGIADFVAYRLGFSGVFDFFRNANYGMLAQTLNDIPRVSGAFPEPSSYAMLCIPLLVFCAELWLQKGDRASALIALALATGIVLSLSTAGFFGVAVYLVLLAARTLSSFRSPEMFARLVTMLTLLVLVAGMAASIIVFYGEGLSPYTEVLSLMTVDKLDSSSASERSSWAAQGLNLFAGSLGFGVGAGSFRSSSILTAVIGSFGIAGIVLMAVYVWNAISVIFRSARDCIDNRICAWAAIGALVPQVVVGVSPDPGFIFAVFAGFAMAQQRARTSISTNGLSLVR